MFQQIKFNYMKKSISYILAFLLFNISFSQQSEIENKQHDQLIIRGATLVNGNGSPPVGPVDIVIENNIIK